MDQSRQLSSPSPTSPFLFHHSEKFKSSSLTPLLSSTADVTAVEDCYSTPPTNGRVANSSSAHHHHHKSHRPSSHSQFINQLYMQHNQNGHLNNNHHHSNSNHHHSIQQNNRQSNHHNPNNSNAANSSHHTANNHHNHHHQDTHHIQHSLHDSNHSPAHQHCMIDQDSLNGVDDNDDDGMHNILSGSSTSSPTLMSASVGLEDQEEDHWPSSESNATQFLFSNQHHQMASLMQHLEPQSLYVPSPLISDDVRSSSEPPIPSSADLFSSTSTSLINNECSSINLSINSNAINSSSAVLALANNNNKIINNSVKLPPFDGNSPTRKTSSKSSSKQQPPQPLPPGPLQKELTNSSNNSLKMHLHSNHSKKLEELQRRLFGTCNSDSKQQSTDSAFTTSSSSSTSSASSITASASTLSRDSATTVKIEADSSGPNNKSNSTSKPRPSRRKTPSKVTKQQATTANSTASSNTTTAATTTTTSTSTNNKSTNATSINNNQLTADQQSEKAEADTTTKPFACTQLLSSLSSAPEVCQNGSKLPTTSDNTNSIQFNDILKGPHQIAIQVICQDGTSLVLPVNASVSTAPIQQQLQQQQNLSNKSSACGLAASSPTLAALLDAGIASTRVDGSSSAAYAEMKKNVSLGLGTIAITTSLCNSNGLPFLTVPSANHQSNNNDDTNDCKRTSDYGNQVERSTQKKFKNDDSKQSSVKNSLSKTDESTSRNNNNINKKNDDNNINSVVSIDIAKSTNDTASSNKHSSSADAAQPFKCEHCNSTFTRLGNFTRHKKIHTVPSKDGQRFKCDVCSKSFLQRCDLVRHTHIHTHTEPHRCNICGKGYIRRSDLVTHQRFHNKEKPFTCQHCSKGFSQRGDLNRHLRSIHLQIKPILCPCCNRKFAKQETLLRHLNSAHREKISHGTEQDQSNLVIFGQNSTSDNSQSSSLSKKLTTTTASNEKIETEVTSIKIIQETISKSSPKNNNTAAT